MRQSAVSNIQNLIPLLTKSSFSPEDIQTINNELTTISTFDRFYQEEISHVYFLFVSLFCNEDYFNLEFPKSDLLPKIFEKFMTCCKSTNIKVFELTLKVFSQNCKVSDNYLKFLVSLLQSDEFMTKFQVVLELILFENQPEETRQKLDLFVSRLNNGISHNERMCLQTIITQIPSSIFTKMVNSKDALILFCATPLVILHEIGEQILWTDGGLFINSIDRSEEQFIWLKYLLENMPHWRDDLYNKFIQFVTINRGIDDRYVLKFVNRLFAYSVGDVRERSELMLSHLEFLANLQTQLPHYNFINAEDCISPYPEVAEYLAVHHSEVLSKHVGIDSPLLSRVVNHEVKTPVYQVVQNQDTFGSFSNSFQKQEYKEPTPVHCSYFRFDEPIETKPVETKEQTPKVLFEEPKPLSFPRYQTIVCMDNEMRDSVISNSSPKVVSQPQQGNSKPTTSTQEIPSMNNSQAVKKEEELNEYVKQVETNKRNGKVFDHLKRSFEFKFNQKHEITNFFTNLIDVKICYSQKLIIVANEENDQFTLHLFNLSDRKFKKKLVILHEITSMAIQKDSEGLTNVDGLIITSKDSIFMYDLSNLITSQNCRPEWVTEIPPVEGGYNVKKPNLVSVCVYSDVDSKKDLIISVDSARQWVYVHNSKGEEMKSIGISSVFCSQYFKFQLPTLVDVNMKQGLFVIGEKSSFKAIIDNVDKDVETVFSVEKLRNTKGLVIDQLSENVIVSDIDGTISVFSFDGTKLKLFSSPKCSAPGRMCIDQQSGDLLVIEGKRIVIFE